jgi:hypothetical protein
MLGETREGIGAQTYPISFFTLRLGFQPLDYGRSIIQTLLIGIPLGSFGLNPQLAGLAVTARPRAESRGLPDSRSTQ